MSFNPIITTMATRRCWLTMDVNIGCNKLPLQTSSMEIFLGGGYTHASFTMATCCNYRRHLELCVNFETTPSGARSIFVRSALCQGAMSTPKAYTGTVFCRRDGMFPHLSLLDCEEVVWHITPCHIARYCFNASVSVCLNLEDITFLLSSTDGWNLLYSDRLALMFSSKTAQGKISILTLAPFHWRLSK